VQLISYVQEPAPYDHFCTRIYCPPPFCDSMIISNRVVWHRLRVDEAKFIKAGCAAHAVDLEQIRLPLKFSGRPTLRESR
jgi:hypothetical protein